MSASGGLVILVPVLNRPQNVKPLLDSIFKATPSAWVVFLTDPLDQVERDEIQKDGRAQIADLGGNYASKINHGIRTTEEPLIFLGADDLTFHEGWLDAAKAKLTAGIGVVGTNDLGSPRVMRGEHATHSLVTREYAELGSIDDPSVLLHEGYDHNFVDDELVATAKHRGAWAFAEDSHVEHHHPFWRKGEMDETYQKGQMQFRRDRFQFKKRTPLWT